jgi:hypothetical protein
MPAKDTWTKPFDQKDEGRPNPHARPAEERYRLRVDSQFKQSFKTKEAATAGGVIKKAYPVVMVTIVDGETGATDTVALE